MTPSLIVGDGNWAVKSDSLLGYKTIDGKYYPREMTFTRATTGTRVNEAGLVEVVPYNLLSWSEQFDNAAWSVLNRITVASNTTTAPNGTLTADSIIENTATGSHYIGQVAIVGTQYNLSVYAKINGRNRIAITEAGGIVVCIFNISNGTIVSGAGNIENVGNGWYRCSATYTATYTSATINLVDDLNNISYTGNGTSGVYLWGGQLVEGTQPLTYLPTTDRLDIARIDYSTGSAALLLEPQRTNLAWWSNQFDDAAYTKQGITITSNATTSPDGTANADRMFETGITFNHGFYQSRTLSIGTNYAMSCYVKKGNRNYCGLQFWYNTTAGAIAFFNLDNGTLVYEFSEGSGYSVSNSKIQDVGNGWYRLSATFQVGLAVSYPGLVMASTQWTTGTSYDNQYEGDSSKYIDVWGFQLEEGSYPTSYIPTTSASVTRNADSVSKTGISSLIGQTEGTIFLNMNNLAINSDWLTLNPISGSPYTNSIGIGYYANAVRLQIYSPSGTAFGTLTSISGNNKIALAYKSGDIAMYINGVNVFSSSNAFSFNVLLDSITVASQSWLAGSIAANKIYSHSLYTTRLTNSELAQLTTP